MPDDGQGAQVRQIPVNVSSFSLNPSQRVMSREFSLTDKQEQVRLNRLKQLYGTKDICPAFLFEKNQNHNSLSSMEPVILDKDISGKLQVV